jgi:branched-chain amino acid transport system substrate-binding protein
MLGEFEKWNYKPGFSFKKRVAVLNEKQLWGMEQHEIWRPLAEKQGWEIVMDEFVDLEATDFSSIIAKIKMEKPDLILCEFFYFRCVMMLKQMIEQNVTASFVVMPETATSYDWIDPSKGVGPIGNGILALSYFPPDYHGGGADYLRTKYKELYGIEPSAHEVMGFSAIEIIKQAIEKARSLDSEAIRKVLLSETFETCFTKVKFDKEGCNELYRPAVAQWINNKLEVVWPTDRATAKPLYPWPPK